MEDQLTPEEVAEKMKVSKETVWRWCRAGLGSRYGRTYRITPTDLTEWAKNTDSRVSA